MVSIEGKTYISTKVKLLVLEVLNMVLSYPEACERFLNYKIADSAENKTDNLQIEFFKKESMTTAPTETSSRADKKEKRSRSRKKSSKKK